MFLRELFEAKARRIVAVMPGGFHPFHPGHKSLYDWAVKTFGQSNVYVAATNDTATRPFPFEVKKKLAAMAGVPESNFIQVKSPFNLNSYKDMLGDDAAIVFVRSQKDKGEQPLPDQTKKNGEPGYLRSYTGKDLNTANEMGYMAYGPTINFDFSGMQIKSASELRATWPEMSDEDKLKAAKLMYGNGAETAVQLLNKALGDPEAPANEILGFVTRTPKRATRKKKPEKFDEPSIQDKIAARRKAAAKGDKDAWRSKKDLDEKDKEKTSGITGKTVKALTRLRGKYPQAETDLELMIAAITDNKNLIKTTDFENDEDADKLSDRLSKIEKTVKDIKRKQFRASNG